MQKNIEPTWEHEENAQGGRVIVSISRKDLAPYLWEVLVLFCMNIEVQLLTTIGEQFDVGNEICGVSVTIKRNCTFMVWNKTATFEKAIHKIEQAFQIAFFQIDVAARMGCSSEPADGLQDKQGDNGEGCCF